MSNLIKINVRVGKETFYGIQKINGEYFAVSNKSRISVRNILGSEKPVHITKENIKLITSQVIDGLRY
jgi:hypothetical protein